MTSVLSFSFLFILRVSVSYQIGDLPPSCDSKIYCQGELLHDVQMSRIFQDSKTFVDKRLRFNGDEVLNSYRELKSQYGGNVPPRNVLEAFVNENFEDGNELDLWQPPDWQPEPSIILRVQDAELRNWTRALNDLWKNLSRKVDIKVKESPELYSLIYVPNGFIIPGGRFRELYYWDTYWIVNGLLICDMVTTAKGVIENLLHLLKIIGHIPNGSRIYYLQRSQPPILTKMMDSYYKKTGDFEFIKKNIQFLDNEMDYWINNRTIEVKKKGRSYKLFRYYAPSAGPRPESYREDIQTASVARNQNGEQALFTSLKSGAESGWDFSTRWFIQQATNRGNISSIRTPDIVPVDLNALLYGDFKTLEEWYFKLGDFRKMRKYQSLSKEILKAINNVFWNEEEGIWLDFDNSNGIPRKYFYLSNFVPLWTKAHTFNPQKITKLVMKYINKYNITQFLGGTPTSLMNSGEQWDYPNAWPPLQAFFIQGLDRIGTPQASDVAFRFAQIYIYSNLKGFQDFGVMFEKYDATQVGRTGEGGEYEAQSGFGWSNGCALEFLKRWGSVLSSSDNEVQETEALTRLVQRYAATFSSQA